MDLKNGSNPILERSFTSRSSFNLHNPDCTLSSHKFSNDSLETLDFVPSSHLDLLGVLLFYEFVSLIVFMIINVHVAAILLVMA